MRGVKTDDSYEDGVFEASQTKTVTRMATRRGSIPVTVGTFEAWVGWGDTIGWRIENRRHISIRTPTCPDLEDMKRTEMQRYMLIHPWMMYSCDFFPRVTSLHRSMAQKSKCQETSSQTPKLEAWAKTAKSRPYKALCGFGTTAELTGTK